MLRASHVVQNQQTALINAVENGHIECVRLLLESGADTEAKDDVRSTSSSSSYIFCIIFFTRSYVVFSSIWLRLLCPPAAGPIAALKFVVTE